MKSWRKHSVAAVSLLVLSVIPFLSGFVSQTVSSSFFAVSEDVNSLVVENDYYKVRLSKSQLSVRELYIKPQRTINIVSSSVPFLGAHELTSFNSMIGGREHVAQWVDAEADTKTLEKVVETPDFVTFRSFMNFGKKPGSLPFNFVEYKTFYADKPYYLVTYTRTYEVDFASTCLDQITFLFSPRRFWYDRNEGGSWYSINSTGDVVQGKRSPMLLHESNIYGKFPFIWVYNTTMNVGYGTILLDAYPISYTMGLYGTGQGSEELGYTEYMLGTCSSEHAEQPITVTYLSVVDDSTSCSYIDSLSTALFTDQSKLEGNVLKPLTSNIDSVDSRFGGDKIDTQVASYGTAMGLRGYYRGNVGYLLTEFFFANGTSTYPVWDWASVCVTDYLYNNTYTRAQWEMNRYELNWTARWEMYRNSDTIKGFFDVEARNNVNITDLCFRIYSGASDIRWRSMEKSYVKANITGGYNPAFKDEGWMIKNLTNTLRVLGGTGNCCVYWHLLKNTSPKLCATGTRWNMTLCFQYFKRYYYEDLDYFAPSDFLDCAQNTSDILRFNKRWWQAFPLFGQQFGMRIMHDRTTKTQLSHSKFSANGGKLTLSMVGDEGITSESQIYVGNKGAPTAVWVENGALSWSYNVSAKLLTLQVMCSGPVKIVVDWRIPGDVNGDSSVDVGDLLRVAEAYGSTQESPAWDEDADLNNDKIIDVLELYTVGRNY